MKTAAFSQYPRGYVKAGTVSPTWPFPVPTPHPTATPPTTTALMGADGGAVDGGADDSASAALMQASESPCIMDPSKGKHCTMGYSVVTRDAADGCEYRYTEWADFNTPGHEKKVDWTRIVGVELYNQTADAGENVNLAVARKAETAALAKRLSAVLRAGPDAARL